MLIKEIAIDLKNQEKILKHDRKELIDAIRLCSQLLNNDPSIALNLGLSEVSRTARIWKIQSEYVKSIKNLETGD